MTEVPKIVHDRLRAAELARAAAGAAHPDADLLTAFAEQSLLPAERDGVLLHLAACGDCRELIAVALPPEALASPVAAEAEAVRMPVKTKAERNWLTGLAWPTLRWAALAAGVVVAGSVALLQHGNTPGASPATSQIAANLPSTPAPEIAPSTTQVPAPVPDQTQLGLAQSKSTRTSGPRVKLPSNAGSGTLEADAKIPDKKFADEKKDSFRMDKLSGARGGALDSPAARSVTESVEVSDAKITSETKPSTAANLMARNEAPAIEKAKPAPPELAEGQLVTTQRGDADKQVQTSAARASAPTPPAAIMNGSVLKKESLAKQPVAPNFKLKIVAGILQRSVDAGLNWQVGLRSDRKLLCYGILGWDVWAGGEAGSLFRSSDGGVTWVPVQPVVRAQSLSADIVSIEVQATQVLVSTSTKEVWSSADNGKSWEKK
jgi:hypothetical protein